MVFVIIAKHIRMKQLLLLLFILLSMSTTNAKEPLKIISRPIEKVNFNPVVLTNNENGLKLAGILFTPRDFDATKQYPAAIVAGPMYSTKELPQSIYAEMLATHGYVTLVYDNSTIGSSEGHPRAFEDPALKGSDARSAVKYLMGLPYVNKAEIGAVGICGSGSYLPAGLINDNNVRAIVSIVPFTIMDQIHTETDEQLLKDKAVYEAGGEAKRLNLIEPGSEGAAYYLNPERGAAPNYVPCVTWSQLEWHKFHPTEIVKNLHKPYLVITAENAFTRPGAEEMYANAPGPKEFHMVKGASHFEMYDGEPYVLENIGVVCDFFNKYLIGK